MQKFDVGQDRPNQKNFANIVNSKSIFTYIIFLSLVFIFLSCASKKQRSINTATNVDLVYNDPQEGEIHQLTTKGNNFDISFSPNFNQLTYVYDDPQLHVTPQVYVKDMVNKTERRLSYNLGQNFHPQLHPNKRWIVYSSTAGSEVEKINITPVMKDLGLAPSEALTSNQPIDIYVLSEDSADIKRITHSHGVEHLAQFSSDGNKIIYVSRGEKVDQIVEYSLVSGQKVVLASSIEPITSLSLSNELIAYTTEKNLIVKKIKANEIVFKSPDGFLFNDVSLSRKGHRLLVISDIEDKKNNDVYLYDLDKKCMTRLTFNSADEFTPVFGPEEKSLFFVSNRSKSKQIYSTMIRESLPCKPWP